MSLFTRMAPRRAQAREVTHQDLWGTGAPIIRGASESQALRLSAVWSAVRLLSDSVASLPMRVYRHQGEDGHLVPIPSPPLITKPSAFGTSYDWVYRAMASLTLRGNAYGLVTATTRDGRPEQVEWLHPDDVALNGEDSILRNRRPEWLVEGRPVPEGELVHLTGFTLGGRILGLSPIAAFRTITETGLYANEFGRDWFANGSTPSAVLETDREVTQGQAVSIKDKFMASVTGRRPVVLGGGVTYKSISVNADESQFLQTIKATATIIAGIYGVPPEDIGGETGGSLTYNNEEQRAARFIRFSLRPYLTRIELALSRLLHPGHEVRFDTDALIRTDLLQRYRAHSLALRDGWKNADEIRNVEGLQPLPDGQGQSYEKFTGSDPPKLEGVDDDGNTRQ